MNEAIVEEAKTWLGTPYHSGAKVKGVGVDCGQLLIACAENAGVLPFGEISPEPYAHDFHLHRGEQFYLGWVEKYCDKVTEPEPGDFVLFQYGRVVSHGAIVVEWPLVIHSYVNFGVILSDVNEGIFKQKSGASRLRGIYRIRR